MGTLLEELKRRKVFRVGTVYAVVAWLLIEVTSTILPTFEAPEWVIQTITLLLIIGFPIAVILAWAYEITPEGIKADTPVHPTSTPTQSGDRNLIYLILVIVVVVAGMQISDRFTGDQLVSNSASTQVVRSTIPLGDLRPVVVGGGAYAFHSILSFSANGSRVSYTSVNATDSEPDIQTLSRIYIRDLDQLEPNLLESPVSSSGGTLSPDGQWVYFMRGPVMSKVPANGGPIQPVATGVLPGTRLAFDEEENVFFTDENFELRQVSVSGGESTSLNITSVPGYDSQRMPFVLPGDSALLFMRMGEVGGGGQVARIDIYDFETGESRVLIEDAAQPAYSPSDHITFMRGNSLWAVPFDLDSLSITGPEVVVVERIERLPLVEFASYSLSASGNLIYVPDTRLTDVGEYGLGVFAWVERDGNETVLDMEPQRYRNPAVSPDGTQVATIIWGDNRGLRSEIFLYDLERGSLSRVTTEGKVEGPIWSTDGNSLIYGTAEGLKSITLSGISEVTTLTGIAPGTLGIPDPTFISLDGQEILFNQNAGPALRNEIYSVKLDAREQFTNFLISEHNDFEAVISPNGQWLAYQSFESGDSEVYVRPYPNLEDGKWQISLEGAAWPMWSPNGDEIFYRRLVRTAAGVHTYSVSIETDTGFRAGTPEILFTSDHAHGPNFTVSRDGQRFLMIKPVGPQGPTQILQNVAVPKNAVLVENFDEELRHLAPSAD